MPNHVTHRVIVRGPAPDLTLFIDTFLTLRTVTDPAGEPHSERTFDFNILVPMPDLIRETESSSSVSDGLIVLGRDDVPNLFGGATSHEAAVQSYLAMPWVKKAGVTDFDGLRRLLLERSPDCVQNAETAIRAFEEYGHSSWYDWSIDNWGTKWNAYHVRILEHAEGRLAFCFDTAWSPPTPIFDALAERDEVKALHFDITAFDEGWNFAFVGTISNGRHLGQIVNATDALHEVVYGPPSDA